MKNYPSNITRQQFELIRPALENFRNLNCQIKCNTKNLFLEVV